MNILLSNRNKSSCDETLQLFVLNILTINKWRKKKKLFSAINKLTYKICNKTIDNEKKNENERNHWTWDARKIVDVNFYSSRIFKGDATDDEKANLRNLKFFVMRNECYLITDNIRWTSLKPEASSLFFL